MQIGDKTLLEIEAGSDPVRALAEAAGPYAGRQNVLDLAIAHEPDCPCTDDTRELAECACRILRVTVTRVA